MNEEMEAEMNQIDLTPGKKADSEDEIVDESIPIQIKKLRAT